MSYLSLSYPSLIRKRYPFTAGLTAVERVFQSSDGEAQPRTHDLPATFITEPLQPLDNGTSLSTYIPCLFGYKACFPFQNNPRNLDPSYKTDLDFGIVWKRIPI